MSFCVNILNQYFYIFHIFMIQFFLLSNINFSETCHRYTYIYKDGITVERRDAICYEANVNKISPLFIQ